ncbi:site-specific integrase [Cecembia rubra]|uniref:Site-specific recombinase XerD n=1 Tax=Cecembia rubra TaxID=1485585 RepID=A0A2P8ECH8_9BACT|nr:site-specific integrase [Cecembia rubra]PSL07150.1 site-specific recombinase XerD [Cecembia rubra]
MRTTNTFGVQFITRTNKAKDGLLPIYARVTVDGRRVEISLKRWIKPGDWNGTKGMAKGSREEIKSLNYYLDEDRARIMECYQEMQVQKRLITADAIKSMFLGTDQKDFTLCKLVDYHNQTMRDTLAWGTMKNYFTTQKYIHRFLKERFGTTDMFLSELSYKFITDFEFYLRNYKPKDHQKPLGNNGVMKHLERFRKMVTMAVKMEWVSRDPFDKYQLKFHRVDRDFLNDEELEAVENKDFKIVRLQWVRDLFVFSCYTGLAYIDAMNLTPSNITIGIDGEYWLSTCRQKTDQPVRVPILPKAWEIIEKYKTHPRAVQRGAIFPMISNQKLNSYLKEIADLCGIEKNLTFHLARHTFATTVTLCNGVPLETVSKMLGHSKITTTQVYAKVVEKKVSEDMQNLREKLAAPKLMRRAK